MDQPLSRCSDGQVPRSSCPSAPPPPSWPQPEPGQVTVAGIQRAKGMRPMWMPTPKHKMIDVGSVSNASHLCPGRYAVTMPGLHLQPAGRVEGHARAGYGFGVSGVWRGMAAAAACFGGLPTGTLQPGSAQPLPSPSFPCCHPPTTGQQAAAGVDPSRPEGCASHSSTAGSATPHAPSASSARHRLQWSLRWSRHDSHGSNPGVGESS